MQRRTFLKASMAGGVALTASGWFVGGSELLAPAFRQGQAMLTFDASGASCEIDRTAGTLTFRDCDGRRLSCLGVSGERGCGALNAPVSVASDNAGRVHVVDLGNGCVQTLTATGRRNGVFAQGFERPRDLAIAEDLVAVCDSGRHHVRLFTPDGTPVTTIGQRGLRHGELNGPASVAFAPDGTLHVVDQGNARVQAFDRAGRNLFSYGAYGPGRREFYSPRCIRFDARGRAWVADAVARRVSVFDSNGQLVRSFSPVDERGRPATPRWLATLPDGGMYLAAESIA